MTEALRVIRRQRAGSMTETERKEIYQLIAAAASARGRGRDLLGGGAVVPVVRT